MKFNALDINACKIIIEKNYEEYLKYLDAEQIAILKEEKTNELLLSNADKFTNAK